VARKPFIYLSAGVDDEVIREQLELATEAGVPYSGVLCGRASWKDGIAIFATAGPSAFEAWLHDRGVRNVQALLAVVTQGAQPWSTIYGGSEQAVVAD
jgi:tagatose 1,6-diphosphate aldolase